MPFIIGPGGAQFKSLRWSAPRLGWDSITAVILHQNTTVSAVRANYAPESPVGPGFFVGDTDIRAASRLPGCVYAEVQAMGAFAPKLLGTGAASAHSESPTGLRIPALGNGVFDKTDILICEPTFEVFAIDSQPPDIAGVGRQVSTAYGLPLPVRPANPFTFDAGSDPTVSYPFGWCYVGVEYEQIGNLWQKRYYYTHRHLLTP